MQADQEIVLITGVGGAIGSRIAKALGGQFRVVGFERDCSDVAGECIEADIASDESLQQAFGTFRQHYGERIAAVIHLAAYFDFTGEQHPLYEKVNVAGTANLLNALQEFKVERFIYSSTMLVHAPTEPGVPINEDSPIDAQWAYPQSKVQAEAIIREQHGALPYVLLRIAGMYDENCHSPTLAHQIQRIYERNFESYLFAGDPSHGQSFIHIDDLVDALVRTVQKRKALPDETALLLGEPAVMSYAALQNEIGRLIHGDTWETLELPKPIAAAGAWMQDKLEVVIPDSIDEGEKPFIKPFMVALADDHYEIDIRRAHDLIGWSPRHTLRETLPAMVAALKDDPIAWYQANKLHIPDWLTVLAKEPQPVETLRTEHDAHYRQEHRRTLWAHFVTLGLGFWLLTSPFALDYQSVWLVWSDVLSGLLVMLFATLSLSWRMGWARWANVVVGIWLLSAPLVFWAPTAAAYLNDTVIGALVIGFALLVRPAPGIAIQARLSGPDIPPGWDYSPSTWMQRLPIIILALIGFVISRYLTAYQLEHIPNVWDPFFAGSTADPQNGTEEIITSSLSEAWPVPDAGIGALTYMLEILTGMLGSQRRWRTMPWLVLLFGIMIVPLGGVSIFFIIIQPIMLDTWCALCLIAAAAMLWQIPYSFDEILATCQFLRQRYRAGRPFWTTFFRGDTMDGGRKSEPEDFTQSPKALIADMLGGGVNLPWSLVLSILIGLWLMCTRLTVGAEGAIADADHLVGALVITVSIAALAEVARPLRFLNALFGLCLLLAPLLFAGEGLWPALNDIVLGLALIALSLPRGRVTHRYAGWNRVIF